MLFLELIECTLNFVHLYVQALAAKLLVWNPVAGQYERFSTFLSALLQKMDTFLTMFFFPVTKYCYSWFSEGSYHELKRQIDLARSKASARGNLLPNNLAAPLAQLKANILPATSYAEEAQSIQQNVLLLLFNSINRIDVLIHEFIAPITERAVSYIKLLWVEMFRFFTDCIVQCLLVPLHGCGLLIRFLKLVPGMSILISICDDMLIQGISFFLPGTELITVHATAVADVVDVNEAWLVDSVTNKVLELKSSQRSSENEDDRKARDIESSILLMGESVKTALKKLFPSVSDLNVFKNCATDLAEPLVEKLTDVSKDITAATAIPESNNPISIVPFKEGTPKTTRTKLRLPGPAGAREEVSA